MENSQRASLRHNKPHRMRPRDPVSQLLNGDIACRIVGMVGAVGDLKTLVRLSCVNRLFHQAGSVPLSHLRGIYKNFKASPSKTFFSRMQQALIDARAMPLYCKPTLRLLFAHCAAGHLKQLGKWYLQDEDIRGLLEEAEQMDASPAWPEGALVATCDALIEATAFMPSQASLVKIMLDAARSPASVAAVIRGRGAKFKAPEFIEPVLSYLDKTASIEPRDLVDILREAAVIFRIEVQNPETSIKHFVNLLGWIVQLPESDQVECISELIQSLQRSVQKEKACGPVVAQMQDHLIDLEKSMLSRPPDGRTWLVVGQLCRLHMLTADQKKLQAIFTRYLSLLNGHPDAGSGLVELAECLPLLNGNDGNFHEKLLKTASSLPKLLSQRALLNIDTVLHRHRYLDGKQWTDYRPYFAKRLKKPEVFLQLFDWLCAAHGTRNFKCSPDTMEHVLYRIARGSPDERLALLRSTAKLLPEYLKHGGGQSLYLALFHTAELLPAADLAGFYMNEAARANFLDSSSRKLLLQCLDTSVKELPISTFGNVWECVEEWATQQSYPDGLLGLCTHMAGRLKRAAAVAPHGQSDKSMLLRLGNAMALLIDKALKLEKQVPKALLELFLTSGFPADPGLLLDIAARNATSSSTTLRTMALNQLMGNKTRFIYMSEKQWRSLAELMLPSPTRDFLEFSQAWIEKNGSSQLAFTTMEKIASLLISSGTPCALEATHLEQAHSSGPLSDTSVLRLGSHSLERVTIAMASPKVLGGRPALTALVLKEHLSKLHPVISQLPEINVLAQKLFTTYLESRESIKAEARAIARRLSRFIGNQRHRLSTTSWIALQSKLVLIIARPI